MARKIIINECIHLAKTRGGACLSKKYSTSREKMIWSCHKGHVWRTTYGTILQGCWCPKCSNDNKTVKNPLEKAQKMAKKHGGCCLSKQYIKAQKKLTWQCKNGHIWKATYNKVQQGKWCRKCYNLRQMCSLQDAKKLAKKYCGKCLSETYEGSKCKLLWECVNGHEWAAVYDSVNKGSWCPKCKYEELSKRFRCDYTKADKIAKSRGGKCLNSVEYKNSRTILLWQCKEGHQWSAPFAPVCYNNTWCPECKKSKTQLFLVNIISELFPNNKILVNCRKFKWLCNPDTGRRLEIDIFVEGLNIAVEYDGEQHFVPVRFRQMTEKEAKGRFSGIKKLDQLKNKLIANNSNEVKYFIRFSCKEKKFLTKSYVKNKLIENGVVI